MAEKAVKLADVAREAGVSHGTASNVFSRPEIVRQEVRDRVHAAAQKMGYNGPSPFGRMLRAGKVNAIGVATAEPLAYFFEDPFARVVMEGISQVCHERGAGISLVSAAHKESIAWNINSALVDGFIIFCFDGQSKLTDLARERRLPFIALDFVFNNDDVPTIGIDDAAGARLAAQHLTELGHRRFGVLALQAHEISRGASVVEDFSEAIYTGTRERLAGYMDILTAAGVDPACVPIFEADNDEATTIAGLEHLFARDPSLTAILAMSDRMALYALDWLRAQGKRVPEDVSIIGFDGVPETARSHPPLTTIAQPIVAMGRRAAAAILDGDKEFGQQKLEATLVVRQSTGRAPRT